MSTPKEYYEFMPAVVAGMKRPPNIFARLVTWTIILFACVTVVWLTYAKVDIVVTAQGKLVPAGKIKLIQTPIGGVVKSIFVSDGQKVKKGEPLVELDQTESDAEEEQLIIKRHKAQITVRRLKAELLGGNEIEQGEIPDILYSTEQSLLYKRTAAFERQIERLRLDTDELSATVERSEREAEKLYAERAQKLHLLEKKQKQIRRGLIPEQNIEELELDVETWTHEVKVAEAKINEARMKLAASEEKLNGAREEHDRDILDELSDAQSELESVRQELIKTQARMARQLLNAPVGGVVQQLTLHTIGGVVQTAEKLMVIVPNDAELEMEAQILNKDIGFVDLNQSTRIKVDAYQYTRYGMIKGDISWIASDAIVDEQKGLVYPTRIRLKSLTLPNMVNNRQAVVLSGMNAAADIVIGERRLIEYFLSTIMRYKDESLNER